MVSGPQGKLIFATLKDVCDRGNVAGGESGGKVRRFTLPVPAIWTARVEPYANQPITLGIRPEHIGSPAAERLADVPRIQAQVEAVEPMGPESYVYLNTGIHAFVSRADAGCKFRVGDHAAPAVATDHLHFFDPTTEKRVG